MSEEGVRNCPIGLEWLNLRTRIRSQFLTVFVVSGILRSDCGIRESLKRVSKRSGFGCDRTRLKLRARIPPSVYRAF